MGDQKCRACDKNKNTILFEKAGIVHYRCFSCNLIFSNPQQNANIENEYDDYETAYLNYLTSSPCDRKNFATLLKWMSKFCSIKGKRILDVGAGSGKFIRFLRETENDAFGLEPAKVLYEKYLSKDPFFFCNYLEEFNEDSIGGKVDVLVSYDVIEHVPQPTVFLENVFRVLKPGGMFFLSTPDVGSLLPRILGKRWHHYHRYHLSNFSRKTIGALVAKNKFRELGFDRLTYLKSVRYILQYINEYVFGSKRINFLEKVTEMAVPMNLGDVMFVALKRD